jgi:hypothetical protein
MAMRQLQSSHTSISKWTGRLATTKDDENEMDVAVTVEEYRNIATQFLSNFLTTTNSKDTNNRSSLSDIQFWNQPKLSNRVPIHVLAQALDAELYHLQWFVTGNVNPIYFANNFTFQDPDVKVNGLQEYAQGVQKIFDSNTSRADILSTVVNPDRDHVITCTWRLSGKVNIGPTGLTIKPYIVYTDFTIDSQGTGLIINQEDRFGVPSWDILLSALFPFVIGILTSPPAPIPQPRNPPPQVPDLSKYRTGTIQNAAATSLNAFSAVWNNIRLGR